MSLNSLVFHSSGGISSSPAALLFLIFLSTESSSSCMNCHSLISSWLLIIFVTGSSVTFSGFPSKFSKCCFHRCIRSSWLAAFSLALAVLFLLLTLFTVCHAIIDCLSSTVSNLIDLSSKCLNFVIFIFGLEITGSFIKEIHFDKYVLTNFFVIVMWYVKWSAND